MRQDSMPIFWSELVRLACLAILSFANTLKAPGLCLGSNLPFKVQHSFGEQSFPLSDVNIHHTWHVLGPFPIGTREAQWGADPLEVYGGFHKLQIDSEASFPSPMVSGGYVGGTFLIKISLMLAEVSRWWI